MHTKKLVESIMRASLAEAQKGCWGPWPFEWTLQGLGMLRTYLGSDRTFRLHVWDDRYVADPTPSELHTHPWDMESLVIAGQVHNTRFKRELIPREENLNYMEQTIFCGTGGGLEGEPSPCQLVEQPVELYAPGETYFQRSTEIHLSSPLRGTVTLVQRQFGLDVDHASVFWPIGEEWVTAEPRDATSDEILEIVGTSLDLYFGGR